MQKLSGVRFLFDDMEPLEEKYRLAQQWIAHYHPHTEYTESEKDG